MQRLRAWDWISGLVGTALFADLFAPWFGAASGWSSLGWAALALTVLALLAALAVPVATAGRQSPAAGVAAGIAGVLLGAVAVLALLIQVWAQPGTDEQVSLRWGWWLGIALAAAVVVAAMLALRDERIPGAPRVEVDVRPVPEPVPRIDGP